MFSSMFVCAGAGVCVCVYMYFLILATLFILELSNLGTSFLVIFWFTWHIIILVFQLQGHHGHSHGGGGGHGHSHGGGHGHSHGGDKSHGHSHGKDHNVNARDVEDDLILTNGASGKDIPPIFCLLKKRFKYWILYS